MAQSGVIRLTGRGAGDEMGSRKEDAEEHLSMQAAGYLCLEDGKKYLSPTGVKKETKLQTTADVHGECYSFN